MLESGEDIYDPYFFLSFDVYYSGELPDRERRREALGDTVAFETLEPARKDRFLLEDVPCRLEYKDESRIEATVESVREDAGVLREGGTYLFYRIMYARELYSGSDWLGSVRREAEALPESFWVRLRESYQARMEHDLGDLAAAVVRDDNLFYLISLADFIRSVCSVLFAVNRRFEPSDRMLSSVVKKLDVLPESFKGRFDSLIRQDSDLTPERKREIATLFAKSVVAL